MLKQASNIRKLCVLALLLLATGCETLAYYGQAAKGQLALLNKRQPLVELIDAEQQGSKRQVELQHIVAVTEYAETSLQLPVGKAYRSFVQLEAPFVVWNVFAAPALSLQAKQWCYPIAGCASYRGYFSEKTAQHYAKDLREKGFDVTVSGVRAYSTLGWFDDPVLSSFLDYSPAQQAALMFHELAHKVSYVAGDTEFNESFARSVELVGMQKWLDQRADQAALQRYAKVRDNQQKFLAMVAALREKLQLTYASERSDSDKLAEKAQHFKRFQQALKDWGEPSYSHWTDKPLNNALLVPLNSYNRWVCALRYLHKTSITFPKFYQRVKHLAAQDKTQRQQRLTQLEEEGCFAL